MKAVVCQKENLARFVELYNQISLEDPFTGQRSLTDFHRDYGQGFEHQVLLVKLDYICIGFIFWSEQRGVITIEQLFLLPEYRQQGYEEELLSQLIQLYRDSGKKAIQSMLSAPNVHAGDCYRSLGFQELSQNVQMIVAVDDLEMDVKLVLQDGLILQLAKREEWQNIQELFRMVALEEKNYQFRSWNDVKDGSYPAQGKGCFFLKNGNRPLGFLTLNIYPLYENGRIRKIGQIYELGITPELRNQGLGRELFKFGLRWGIENGVEEFMVYLNGLHQPAVGFMDSLGFQVERVVSSFKYYLE